MPKKLFLVIGNGFSIDFLNHANLAKQVDVINLFNQGAEVPWPLTGIPGFLSYKHCPNLWSLGARPGMEFGEGLSLIEDIISCANIDASRMRTGSPSNQGNIYGKAYKELVQYLRFLFIHYDDSVAEIPDNIETWQWIEYIKACVNSQEYTEIIIVSYNYDCWIERIFQKLNIPFKVGLIEGSDHTKKITLLKPHGSISFIHRNELDLE